MTTTLRRFTLTAHVAFSVGWLGAVAAYLALAIASLNSADVQRTAGALLSMELVGWRVIVPLALAALCTGLIQSLGTEWGLFRHYWVATKFLLTLVGTVVLLMHMPTISRLAEAAARGPIDFAAFGVPRLQPLIHAGGGLLLLLFATVLSVFKPWGRTPHGLRQRSSAPPSPRARRALLIALAVLAFFGLVVALHVAGVLPSGH